MIKFRNFIKKYFPAVAIVFLSVAIICVIINIISIFSVSFSDFFNNTIAAFFRFLLAKITNIFPFSFAEILIIISPAVIVFLFRLLYRYCKKGKIYVCRFFAVFISSVTVFYSLFVLTFACGYRGTSLDNKLGLTRSDVSASELAQTLSIVIAGLNDCAHLTEYGSDDLSVMPYSFRELSDKLNEEYKSFASENDFIKNYKSNVKSVILSEPMTYTHISGVYTFFTGEANVNVNYPDFTLPFTMAHEMAHQRGIAREDEANFIAFLLCVQSEDIYIRYSGYLGIFDYLTSALSRADKNLYYQTIESVRSEIIAEQIAYSDFFDKYRDSVVADISGSINNSYLISQGQSAGTKSYGLVVDLAVAYYLHG